jgi:hypothetical protein
MYIFTNLEVLIVYESRCATGTLVFAMALLSSPLQRHNVVPTQGAQQLSIDAQMFIVSYTS